MGCVLERLIEIPDQIVDVLESDRQAHHIRGDAGLYHLFFLQLRVRRAGRMDHEALRVADVRQMAPQLERLDERDGSRSAAPQTEREDGTRAAREVLVDERALRICRRPRIPYPCDAVVALEMRGDRHRALHLPVDA